MQSDLTAIDQGWLDLHRAAFVGKTWIELRPVYRTRQRMQYRTRMVAEMPNARGQFRPAAHWDVEVEEDVDVEEEKHFRIYVSTAPTPRRRCKHISLRLAA
jgi:hypothetical protein